MLDKTYQPANYETKIYKHWEESGAFKFDISKKDSQAFVTILPPPNANADLHLGYALDSQLKDILGRWRRLNGNNVLLLPGADHAGFETWAVYEKHLNSLGKSRFDFNRDELYEQVYDFVIKNKTNMENQIKRLGISCDWQQFTFTLDEKIVKRSYQTFKQMWEQDLIYRGKRLVNYCVHHGTGFSDLEVTYKEVKGKLWFIKYFLKNDPNRFITIATTRPETLLGDVAVAVNPSDERYLNFHHQILKLPLTNREIPLICDQRVVSDFGSGALKITPAHDFMDFEIAQSANLKTIEIINKKGQITDQAPPEFVGLSVKEARQLVLKRLEKEGYLIEAQEYNHQVGHCYKCETVLEPLLADQWFVRMQPLAKVAIEKLRGGAIKFYPQNKCEELITYLKQLQDWNISRQIAWGIPIPVFQDEANNWIFDDRVHQKTLQIGSKTYHRDPDVFDTWWSSGQWPFATVDWSDNSPFYPQALMETGVDILRPWVSRMIALSLFVTKQIPFKVVYLHGMVVDQNGVKMSKSKGNVINPLKMIESYGADALRISLCGRISAGQPQRFTDAKIIAGRNFCNKLWNIGRFVQNTCGNKETGKLDDRPVDLKEMTDDWIWHKFQQAKKEVDKNLNNYQLALAWETASGFVWNDLADWYLESSKWTLNQEFLSFLFVNTLRLIHPFAPFLTEAIYLELVDDPKNALLINNVWSKSLENKLKVDKQRVLEFEEIKTLILKTRQFLPLDLRRQSQLFLENEALMNNDIDKLLKQLTAIPQILSAQTSPTGLMVNQQPGYKAWVVLDKDLLNQHVFKLEGELKAENNLQDGLKRRLNNPDYLKKAPTHLVAASKKELEDSIGKIKTLQLEIDRFKNAI